MKAGTRKGRERLAETSGREQDGLKPREEKRKTGTMRDGARM